MWPVLWTEAVARRYHAPLCSCTFFFIFLCALLTLILPLLLSIELQGFLLQRGVWREQPTVNYAQRYIVEVEGTDASNGNPFTARFSTEPSFNALGTSRNMPLTSSESDTTSDGKKDQLDFELSIPLTTDDRINRVRLILVFSYQLTGQFLPMKMETLAQFDQVLTPETSRVYVSGDLRFRQRSLLTPQQDQTRYENFFNNWASSTDSAGLTWQNLYSSYVERDRRTYFEYDGTVTETKASPTSLIVQGRVRYSEDEYRYVPTTGEVFKWAWIQYVSFFVVLLCLIVPFVSSVLQSHLFTVYVSTEDYVSPVSESSSIAKYYF